MDSDTFKLSTNNKKIKVKSNPYKKKCNNYHNIDKSPKFNKIWHENVFISDDNTH